eukprot:scaffold5298_cov67-Phaeocystis_antarctica.AAC.20
MLCGGQRCLQLGDSLRQLVAGGHLVAHHVRYACGEREVLLIIRDAISIGGWLVVVRRRLLSSRRWRPRRWRLSSTPPSARRRAAATTAPPFRSSVDHGQPQRGARTPPILGWG